MLSHAVCGATRKQASSSAGGCGLAEADRRQPPRTGARRPITLISISMRPRRAISGKTERRSRRLGQIIGVGSSPEMGLSLSPSDSRGARGRSPDHPFQGNEGHKDKRDDPDECDGKINVLHDELTSAGGRSRSDAGRTAVCQSGRTSTARQQQAMPPRSGLALGLLIALSVSAAAAAGASLPRSPSRLRSSRPVLKFRRRPRLGQPYSGLTSRPTFWKRLSRFCSGW